ncbi:MAG: hypothetical protein EXR50_05275, partial [Dehalococcoidia bacterium]|nr:hypothetical protein [Dehalococcoidia bacterium]
MTADRWQTTNQDLGQVKELEDELLRDNTVVDFSGEVIEEVLQDAEIIAAEPADEAGAAWIEEEDTESWAIPKVEEEPDLELGTGLELEEQEGIEDP